MVGKTNMNEYELTEWVKGNLNDCFIIIRENKSNHVRLETLIQIELLFHIIRTFHLEIAMPNRDFYKKITSLIAEKRHFFRVELLPREFSSEFNDWVKKK